MSCYAVWHDVVNSLVFGLLPVFGFAVGALVVGRLMKK